VIYRGGQIGLKWHANIKFLTISVWNLNRTLQGVTSGVQASQKQPERVSDRKLALPH